MFPKNEELTQLLDTMVLTDARIDVIKGRVSDKKTRARIYYLAGLLNISRKEVVGNFTALDDPNIKYSPVDGREFKKQNIPGIVMVQLQNQYISAAERTGIKVPTFSTIDGHELNDRERFTFALERVEAVNRVKYAQMAINNDLKSDFQKFVNPLQVPRGGN